MKVVLEGADSSGKSTLATHLAASLGMRLVPGDGPPKAPGEIEMRAHKYLMIDDAIFDRHPCVSEPIYAMLRGSDVTTVMRKRVEEFYEQKPLIVYCRPRGLSAIDQHVVKDGEDPAHVRMVVDKYVQLVTAYDVFALEHAHLLYRIGDDVDAVVAILKALK